MPRFVAGIAGRLLRGKFAAFLIKKLLGVLAKKYFTFVSVGTKRTPLEVFEELEKSYKEENARFIILPMNFDYMGGGAAPADYNTQLKLVLDVRTQYPDKCIPFLCIDPRMGSAEFLEAFVKEWVGPKGFAGIKLYPSLGFYPFDKRLEKVYEYCQLNAIPILTHCTREGAYYAGKKLPAELTVRDSLNPTKYTSARHKQPQYADMHKEKPRIACDNFLDPVNYIDILEKFPRLKLCFAHYGGEEEIRLAKNVNTQPVLTESDAINGFKNNTSWYRIIQFLLSKQEYPNVYTDLSFTLHDDEIFGLLNSELTNPAYKSRILFGTDYFMTTQYKSEHKLYNEFRTALVDPGSWKQIAFDNTNEFLHSTFFNKIA